ncbi:MAG: CYTH domain-containing protein [Nanoarchaeota archaeon]|nr:CYTH domain-containing protein [Nanoarchaeota archaeon]MBU0962661.1 CYTH domain-containing protein [Nanoarchaeota archaeon]
MDIEVETRSFITEQEYKNLIEFMKKNAEFVKDDYQITYYFSGEKDLRVQQNNFFSKIWFKEGQIHDKYRKELEIKIPKEDFDKIVNLFETLGFSIEIKWFRKRMQYNWNNVKVTIDNTKGYGYIIELEKMSDDEHKESVYKELIKKLKELNIKETPSQIFKDKFEFYKQNWRDLV